MLELQKFPDAASCTKVLQFTVFLISSQMLKYAGFYRLLSSQIQHLEFAVLRGP